MEKEEDHWNNFTKYNKTENCNVIRLERLKYLKKILGDDIQNELDVLSIGAADAKLDEMMLRETKMKLASYHAIEPAEEFQDELKNRIAQWNVPYTIEQTSFSEHYKPQQGEVKYDLIVMSSVLYYMENIGLAIQNARSLLKPTGKLIIFHQTDNCGWELYKCHLKAFPEIVNTTFAYGMSHKDVLREADKLKIPYKCHVVEDIEKTQMDFDEFVRCIMGNTKVPKHHFVDFMVQRSVEELPEWLRKQMYEIVLKHAVLNDENRYVVSVAFAVFHIDGIKAN